MSDLRVYDFVTETQQEEAARTAFIAETYEQFIRDYPVKRHIGQLAINQRFFAGMINDVNDRFRDYEWWQTPSSGVELEDVVRVRRCIANITTYAMFAPAYKYWGEFPVLDKKISVTNGIRPGKKITVDEYNRTWAQEGAAQYFINQNELPVTEEITTEIPIEFSSFPPPIPGSQVELTYIKSVLDYDDQQLKEFLGIAS